MFTFRKNLSLIIMLIAAVTIVGCSKGFTASSTPSSQSSVPSSAGATVPTPTNGLVQSNSVGAVTIDVEWKRAEQGLLVFSVSMDTHSVDLDKLNLQESSVLRDDTGREYRPTSWRSAAGGHHRSGTLTFPLPDSVSQGKARYLELVVRDVAGVKERVLKWQLKQS